MFRQQILRQLVEVRTLGGQPVRTRTPGGPSGARDPFAQMPTGLTPEARKGATAKITAKRAQTRQASTMAMRQRLKAGQARLAARGESIAARMAVLLDAL